MANYMGTVRTNYFRVTDERRYNELVEHLCGEDDIHFWTKEIDGVMHVGFGCYAPIAYQKNGELENLEDTFFPEMQKILADGDALILMESGNEKLRYVVGVATVVTKDEIVYVDMSLEALKLARQALKNPDFKTVMDY